MKYRVLLASIILGLIITVSSCKGSSGTPEFDHAGQALLDDATLKDFLETHYYIPAVAGEDFGVIDTIENDETPLMDLVQVQNVNFDNIDYKLYYLKNTPEGSGKNPIRLDEVFTKYKGITIDNKKTKFDERITYTWLSLTSVVPGWSYGFPNFKSGLNVDTPEDQPIEIDSPGTGVLFLPSGLGYRNLGSGSIAPNTPLLFHIKLGLVKRGDQDGDGIFSIFEDLNGDSDYDNDDTNDNNRPNYSDPDDDGDNVATKYEMPDANDDGNPNDALDTDGDNIPNYLDDDDDNDGILTKYEVTVDRYGNPENAPDSDGDNIPDYLDPTN